MAMSFNRENVIWESKDGTWNRGFYKVVWTGDDPEWDVEYDFTAFEWVRTGLRSEQAAEDCWDGANPGGWDSLNYRGKGSRGNPERCRKFDRMAASLKKRAAANRSATQRSAFSSSRWI